MVGKIACMTSKAISRRKNHTFRLSPWWLWWNIPKYWWSQWKRVNKEFYYFGKPARVTWYGDWKYLDRDKLGRTLQIGCRTSDKLLRAYEKGKQLGDKNSEWVRLEVELKRQNIRISLLMLLSIPLITSSTYIHALKNCLFTMIKSNPVLNTSSALYQSKLIKAWTFCVISLDVGWVSLENGLVMMKRVWRRSPYLLAFPKVRINKTRLGKDKSCLGYLTKWAKDCGGAATTTKDAARWGRSSPQK